MTLVQEDSSDADLGPHAHVRVAQNDHNVPESGLGVRCTVAASNADRWGWLMAQAQMGDQRAYRILVVELKIWLRRFYARRLRPDLVEDAVQDALLAAHSSRHTYLPSRPFGPWIAAIARYKWVDHLREGGRFKLTELKSELPIPDHGGAVLSSIVVDDLLSTLKPAQANAIRVVKLEGETIESAARRTGQSEALIKVNIHRGIKKLSTTIL